MDAYLTNASLASDQRVRTDVLHSFVEKRHTVLFVVRVILEFIQIINVRLESIVLFEVVVCVTNEQQVEEEVERVQARVHDKYPLEDGHHY